MMDSTSTWTWHRLSRTPSHEITSGNRSASLHVHPVHPMNLLIDNIGELVTNDPALGRGPLGIVPRAAVLLEDGVIAWVGRAAYAQPADRRLDAEGAAVLPGFVDSHAHLVFAGDRAP